MKAASVIDRNGSFPAKWQDFAHFCSSRKKRVYKLWRQQQRKKKRQKVAAAIIFETAKTVTKGYYCISVFFANVKFFSLFSRTRNEKSETRFSFSDGFFGLSWVVKSGKRRWPLRFAKNLKTWTGSRRTLYISWPWRRSSRWLSGTYRSDSIRLG